MRSLDSIITADSESGRVTIGRNPLAAIRKLSDARALRCLLCGAPVVLKAGDVVRPHFAHLAGAECRFADSEPETDEHRAGKQMLAEWAALRIPGASITPEASISESGQRADVLIVQGKVTVALEFQCADLSGRDWLRRHRLYRAAGIRDLWILGGSRLKPDSRGFAGSDLETTLFRYRAPLLVFDPIGSRLEAGTLARFRNPRHQQAASTRRLADLPFPWNLLDWPLKRVSRAVLQNRNGESAESKAFPGDSALKEWLRARCAADPDNLPPLFGIRTNAEETFACSAALWRAALYYRFIDGRVGEPWRMRDVATWARRFLPPAVQNETLMRRALYSYEGILTASGMLDRESDTASRVINDLRSLPNPPDPDKVAQMAAYQRSLRWEAN